MLRDFKDVVFEDVVFDNNSPVTLLSIVVYCNSYVKFMIMKHHILKHHIPELRNALPRPACPPCPHRQPPPFLIYL